jgi:NAD-dependent dihydropyrimidine dehydrogenase PreA subunit
MTELRRYSHDDDMGFPNSFQEDPDGKWMKADEVLAVLAQTEQEDGVVGCLHLAELYVGESANRGSIIECLHCGLLRTDDSQVPPVRDYEQGRKDERAMHVNPDCVWGEGECVPDCPSCKRMDEMYSEWCRGYDAGESESLTKAVQRFTSLPTTYHEFTRGDDMGRFYTEKLLVVDYKQGIAAIKDGA